jgi:protein TonB
MVNAEDAPNAPAVRSPVAAPVSAAPAAPAPAAAPATPRIELPSSNAAYLKNPSPTYPSISKRMGEQGKVLLRVLISAEGLPEQVEIKQSSGYERLDRQAHDTVLRWRFVPGKRNGTPEAMWYLVPINFVLE